eukprot:TRINITY_DN6380_c0_g2_i1.p1 TRINITY_DN6380_c0_g2~~TRINITY_DN6380_c0_g2_i1.p1  ORF type:complete len:203 (-),score=19.70 TRINITY_DN6380_c0_g2_i1:46-612(-)
MSNLPFSSTALVIDSLSSLILHLGLEQVIKLLQTIRNSTKVRFFPILVVLHNDLHDDFIIKSIERLAVSIITMNQPPSDTLIAIRGTYQLIQKRKSGKATKSLEHYIIHENMELKFFSDNEVKKKVTQQKQKESLTNLTFNLELTEEQKAAKDKVILPYSREAQASQKSEIIFDEDDFDSDPDEDLDI